MVPSSMLGSPPYTWGALTQTVWHDRSSRITPIYMGSTRSVRVLSCTAEDHPHIHGEHTDVKHRFYDRKGSPPYTWGAPGLSSGSFKSIGITPIYMGSTSSLTTWKTGNEDHPHIHGEHDLINGCCPECGGSPPYTWGARPSRAFGLA